MKYTPKTTDELRKLTAIYAQTAAQEARINSISSDLAHCEQCLAERGLAAWGRDDHAIRWGVLVVAPRMENTQE